MWTNALMELVNAIKTVTITLDHIPAPVMLATHSVVMVYNAKVFHVMRSLQVMLDLTQ